MAQISLEDDYKDFLRSFNRNRVEYLLIGGYAVNHYGYVRNTYDMDLWVRRSPENAQRIVQAIREFGFDVPGLNEQVFQEPGRIIRMGHKPICIEVLTQPSGVVFDDCAARAERHVIEGVEIPFIALSDLLRNKRASGRLKDLADVEELDVDEPRTQ